MFSYNNSYHRTKKNTPSAARHEDQQTLWIRQYGDAEKKKPKLSENDFVRVSLIKKFFERDMNKTGQRNYSSYRKLFPETRSIID